VIILLNPRQDLRSLTPEERAGCAAFWTTLDKAITQLRDATLPASTLPAVEDD
jgi:hypothetical protein